MVMSWFLPSSVRDPMAVGLRAPEGTRTWGGLEERARRIARGLQAQGLEEGDRAAVLMSNRIEFVEVMLGCLRGGVLLVPINWHLAEAEVAHILRDSDAKALFCDRDQSALGRAAAARAGLALVLEAGADLDAWCRAQDSGEAGNTLCGGPMFYTSGTTGQPKGVLNRFYQQPIDKAGDFWRDRGGLWRYDGPGVHLVACPLYHSAPFANVFFSMSQGQSVVIMPRFDAEETLRLIAAQGVTTTHLVPTQLLRLLRLPDAVKARHDLRSLRAVYHGAAPCPPWVKQAIIEWFGPVLLEYYAFSEAIGSTFADSHEWLARPGTVGRPPPGTEIMVTDEAGVALPAGTTGTLYFRRPSLPLPAYHKAPEKTDQSLLPGGWFTVGDVGWVDEAGYLFLSDRKIDMIISGGVNIYPAEVEAALSEHPAVADCAVFGVPDPDWGEQVKAAVALLDGRESREADLIAWCRDRIAGFKCPRSVDFHASLPRDPSGKLKKRLLRDPYWQGQERRI